MPGNRAFREGVSHPTKKWGKIFRVAWKRKSEQTFETFVVPWEKTCTREQARNQEGSSDFGKRREGVKEDSSFHLRSPDNAVTTPTVKILVECGTPSVLVNIEVCES